MQHCVVQSLCHVVAMLVVMQLANVNMVEAEAADYVWMMMMMMMMDYKLAAVTSLVVGPKSTSAPVLSFHCLPPQRRAAQEAGELLPCSIFGGIMMNHLLVVIIDLVLLLGKLVSL